MDYPDRKTKQAVDMANQFAGVAFDHLAKLGVAPRDLAPEKLKQSVSKQSHSRKVTGAAKAFIARALRGQSRQLQRRSAQITHKMIISLKRAFPDMDPRLIGSIVADLGSLWDTGQKLDLELNKLFQMRLPEDREDLREFLAFVEATQMDMVEFWIRNLRQKIPRLHEDLDRQERNERPHSRKRLQR